MMVPLLLLIVAMTTLPPSIIGIVPPKTPVLSGFEPAAIGSNRELVCDASQPNAGTITYKWYKYSIANGVENWEPKGPIGTSHKYVFNKVTEKKVFHGGTAEPVSGKYLCRASNSAGTIDSEWGDLYVYTPCPLYTVIVSPLKPAIGSTFTLNCYIANPSGLTVNWLKKTDASSEAVAVANANKGGCTAPSNPRYSWSSCSPPSISSPTKTFNLQVANAQPSDSAYWICQDVSLSCNSNPVKSVVQAHPGTPQITGFPSGPVIAGAQLNLKCVASPPGDTYDWYKDGTKVTTSSSYDFQVTKESAGVYKCVARNDVGSAPSSDKTLVVYYKPDSVVVSPGKTSSYVGETDKFTCTVSGGNPTPTVTIYFKRSGGTPVEVTQSQEKVMAKEENQAEYYCEAKVTRYPALDITSSRKTYNVTFANTKVFFLNNPTAAVQAGQVKKFTCETDESNPVTDIKWYQHIIGSSWRNITTGISSSERNGAYGGKIRISEWSVTATKAMNGATVRCTPTYSLTGHVFTTNADTTMYVKYKPDSVVVSSGKTSSYVGEKDKFTCTVSGGNPTPTVKLYFKRSGGTPVEVTQGQDRVMAKEDNQAEYYCEAKVTGYPAFDMTSSRKTYNVTFSNTKVSFLNNPTAAVQAGQEKKFTCETDESNRITNIKWYQNTTGSPWRDITTGISSSERNGVYGGKIRISEWSVTATKAMNGAVVNCTSTYSLTGHGFTTSTDTTMYVKFNPSKMTLTQKPPTSINEGKLFNIVCETDSANPVANITFHRKRTVGTWEQLTSGITSEVRAAEYNGMIRKSTLTVTANRSDTQAVFKCEVKDDSFQVEQTVTVNVYYPPTTVTISSDPKPVKEGDNLTCAASGGNPTSYTYKWFYKNKGIPNESSKDYIYVTNIQYAQSGTYRCQATNYSPDGVANVSLHVDIQYKAKWNPELPEVFTVASKPDTPMEFILHVIANPPPSNVTWFFPNMTTIGGAFVAAKVNDTTYTLNKTSVAVKDYGNYIVNVTNAIGISTFTFELEKTAVPNVSLTVERKDNQVTVSWPKLSKEYTKIQIKFCPIEGGSCDYHNVSNTTSLKSSFTVNEGYTYTYSMIIFDGEDLVFVSSPVKVPTSLPIGAIAGGVGGFIFFLIIIAIVLAVVFILKKRRAKKETEVLTPSNNNGDVSVGQVNPGFSGLDARHNDVIDGFNPYEDSVEMIPPSSSVQIEATGRAEYAVVNKKGGKKPTIGDAYAEVDFTKKKGGKKGSAQPPPGQAYAEVDFSKKAKGKGKGKAPVPTVDPAGDVDATVSKPKEPSKLPKAGKSGPDDAAVYANVPNGDDSTEENLYEDIRKDEPKETGYRQPKEAYQVGVDGTIYSQVHISPPKNPDLIRGKETIEDPYASVDFTCQAPTLPEPEDPDDPNDPSFMMLL